MKNWKKILSILSLALITATSFSGLGTVKSVGALEPGVNKTDPKNTYKDLTQDIFLPTNPDQTDIKYTTNIQPDRLVVYKKSKNTPLSADGAGGPNYFITQPNEYYGYKRSDGRVETYQNTMYHYYRPGYSGLGFDIKNPQPTDKISTYHTKAAKYKDKWVDIEVTYSNFQYKYNMMIYAWVHDGLGWDVDKTGVLKNHVYLDVNENLTSGYLYMNAESMKINLKFIDNQTKQPILVDSYDSAEDKSHSFLTFNSLNRFDNAGMPAFTEFVKYNDMVNQNQVFVTNDTNIEYGHPLNTRVGNDYFYGVERDFTDILGAQTFTRNSVSFELRGSDPNRGHTFTVGATDAIAWNAFSGATLFKSIPPQDMQPKKFVKNTSGQNIQGQTLDVQTPVDWEVTVPVGRMGVDMLEKYTKLQLRDTLPNEVEYLSYQVFNESNKDITSETTLAKANQLLTVDFTPAYLNSGMRYEGETYRIVFHTKIKADAPAGVKIQNQANVTYDKVTLETNRPFVYSQTPIPTTITKSIVQDGTEVKESKVADNQTVVYRINTQVTNANVTSLVIKDQLEAPITLQDAVVAYNGHDVTSQGTLSLTNNTFTWTAKTPNDWRGKKLVIGLQGRFTMTNKVIPYLDKASNTYRIPNLAHIVVNGKDLPSNKVVVVPNMVQPSADKFIIKSNN